ncbi:hypothetical protein CVS40_3499 [Lucilia cuprina]|nr:hypothetical protein CVS40_3499 [Lucilia cuprina]
MKITGVFLNILVLITSNQLIKGWYVEFESYKHEYNPDIVKIMDLHLINATTHRSVITGSIIFNQDIDQFDVLFFITSLKRNGKPWTMLNLTIKGCDFIAKSRRKNMNFPYIVLGELRAANPNFPKSCPIKKDTEIVLKDFYINSEKISLSFPELSFTCDFTLRQHRLQVFKIIVNGSVRTK